MAPLRFPRFYGDDLCVGFEPPSGLDSVFENTLPKIEDFLNLTPILTILVLLGSNLHTWNFPCDPTQPWFCWALVLHFRQKRWERLASRRTKMGFGTGNRLLQRIFPPKWEEEEVEKLPKFSKNTPCWSHRKLNMNTKPQKCAQAPSITLHARTFSRFFQLPLPKLQTAKTFPVFEVGVLGCLERESDFVFGKWVKYLRNM